jgi:predicted AlkP superfamily pyrophosphatase or phosphodiesterase
MKVMLILYAVLLANYTSWAQKFTNAKHVVVIGVDGLSPGGISKAYTPHLDGLIKNGAHSFKAQAVMPPAAVPTGLL